MARTETDQLLVKLEARVRDFEKNMQRASKTADKQFGNMRKSAAKAGKDMESSLAAIGSRVSGALGKLGLGGIAAGGVAGMVAGVANLAKGITQTGDAARKAGIDFKSFQQLAYVARVNRIEVDKVTDGIKELQLRGSEFFTTGGGSAAEAFKALGYSADEVREKLKKPSEFLTEIIGKLGQLDKASQINMADKLFGGSAAEDFVRLIDQGADGIRRTIAEGEALGAVLSDDVLKKAEELDGLIRVAADSVGNFLKKAIVEAAWEFMRFFDAWKEFKNQRTSTLDSELTSLGAERLEIENEILRIQDEQRNNQSAFAQMENRLLDGTISAKKEQLAEIARKEAEILAILASRTPETTNLAPITITSDSTDTRKPSRSSAVSEIERERKAADELIASLEEELRLIHATDEARRAAEASRRLGAGATQDQRDKVISLTEALYQEKAAMEAAKKAGEEWNQSLEAGLGMVTDSILSIADGSVKAEDAVRKLAIQLALAAAQGLLLGSGPLAGLFGGGGGGCLAGQITFTNFTGAAL